MNVLVLGSGGREHALAWKIAASPLVEKAYIAPGNAGTAAVGENVALDTGDAAGVIAFCREKNIGLVVVGPDDLLAAGIVDALSAEGIPVFGPTKAAAEIEWSKAYAKEVMEAAGIPTAASGIFRDADAALAYVRSEGTPIVVKASGLALGKGVVVAMTLPEAEDAVRECFGGKFGAAGSEIVIEEFLTGTEFSTHALCAGTEALLFPSSKDHKRIGEGDTGPNTGGMGVVAPLPGIAPEVMEEVRSRIVMPLLRTLAERERPFVGLLYPGIMLTSEGPKVIEFNARFGDPETQAYMRLMESDIVPALYAAAKGDVSEIRLAWKPGAVASVVLASGGYPGAYEKGKEITGIEDAEAMGAVVFHAGTKRDDAGVLRTNGGRVLNVTATGKDLRDALVAAYAAARKISFEGMQFRSDIGKRVI